MAHLGLGMGYYDPRNDMYEYEQHRAMQQFAQMQQSSALIGLERGIQNATKPVTNPEPNPVLLLLE